MYIYAVRLLYVTVQCSFWLHWTLVNFTYSDEHEPMPYADTNFQIWQTCLGSLAQGKFQTQIKICILQIKVREASLCWHKVNLSIEFHVLLHEEPRTDACASLFEGPPNGHLDRVALPPPANFSGTFSYNPSLFSFKIFPLSWKVKKHLRKIASVNLSRQGKNDNLWVEIKDFGNFWYYYPPLEPTGVIYRCR